MVKKKKSPKLPKKKQLIKDCLELWSKCCRSRDQKCLNCGSENKLSSHHIRSISHNSTKFDLNNGLTLCWGCHSQQKWHPERFQDMVIEVIGQEEYDRLKRMSLVVVDQTVDDLEQIKFELEVKLKQIRAGVNFD